MMDSPAQAPVANATPPPDKEPLLPRRPPIFQKRMMVLSDCHNADLAESPRKPCNAATTCAPSPIAPPIRLTEPERTSPTANTPGTEVSSCEIGRPRLR